MNKPFDLEVLFKGLKEDGLIELEDGAAKFYARLKMWIKESAALHPNAMVKLAGTFVDQADPMVLPIIDKIDGKVG